MCNKVDASVALLPLAYTKSVVFPQRPVSLTERVFNASNVSDNKL
jgi:hypothetical protein